MEHLGNINMKNMVIGPRKLADASEADSDLESLLNLIRPLPRPQYYYASTTTDKDTTAKKPKLITVGDSFWWNITNQAPMSEIFSSYPYWYYNSSIYFDKAHRSVKEVEMVDELLSADFINLFYSSTQLYKLNNDFTKKALLALCYDPEEIDSVSTTIKRDIRSDSAWMAKMIDKAETKGKDLDEVINEETQWLIDNNPEKYFPALKDSIPTKRAKRVQAYLAMDSLYFVEQEVKKTIETIKGNEAQMEVMREKSAKKGKTLEQTIHDDAQWIVNRKIEKGTIQIPTKGNKSKTKNVNEE